MILITSFISSIPHCEDGVLQNILTTLRLQVVITEINVLLYWYLMTHQAFSSLILLIVLVVEAF